MTVYIDKAYRCHAEGGEGLRAVEEAFFDDKAEAVIEGYRYIPAGESWTRADGAVFPGVMIAPAEDHNRLLAIQTQHERDEQAHLEEIGALIEEIYNEDVEGIDNV